MLRDRGSRFLAFVEPVADEAAIGACLKNFERQYSDATHVCYAWRLAPDHTRSADAGEPSGTAGAPILQALETENLVEVLAVVVRYYGGTKLGRGGLIRAYGGAVRAALQATRTEAVLDLCVFHVEVDYQQFGALERLIRPLSVRLEAAQFGGRVRAELWVEDSLAEQLAAQLSDLRVDFRRSS